MQIAKTLVLLAVFVLPLSGCYTLFVGAAGAGAGYVAKDQQDKNDGKLD